MCLFPRLSDNTCIALPTEQPLWAYLRRAAYFFLQVGGAGLFAPGGLLRLYGITVPVRVLAYSCECTKQKPWEQHTEQAFER